MNPIQRLVRWYKLNYGIGNAMLEEGAELLPCPHCETRTPVYTSTYDSAGEPVSFTVCPWCTGLIELREPKRDPHEPYRGSRERRLNRRRSDYSSN